MLATISESVLMLLMPCDRRTLLESVPITSTVSRLLSSSWLRLGLAEVDGLAWGAACFWLRRTKARIAASTANASTTPMTADLRLLLMLVSLRGRPAMDQFVMVTLWVAKPSGLRHWRDWQLPSLGRCVVGARFGQRTEAADRPGRPAGVSSVPDQLDMERVDLLIVQHVLEQVVGAQQWRARRQHAKPAGDPIDMGVHRQGGPAEAEQEHDGRRLAPDAGQRREPVSRLAERKGRQEGEIPGAAGIGAHLGEHVLDARRLGRRQAAGSDHVGQLVERRLQHVIPGRVTGSQRGEGAERVDVGGVLRKDGEYQ